MRPIANRGLFWCQADRPGAVRGCSAAPAGLCPPHCGKGPL